MQESTIPSQIDEFVEAFSSAESQTDRYRYLIELAEEVPELSAAERTPDDYISGCQYDVWIRSEYNSDRGVLHFRAGSNSKIVRGLAAVLIRVVDGQRPEAVLETDFDFLGEAGFESELSARRQNGLRALLEHVRGQARHHANHE